MQQWGEWRTPAAASVAALSCVQKPMASRDRSDSPSQRQLRVAEQIRHLVAEALIRGELHDTRLHGTNVTIGEVRISRDLRHATVFAAELGKELSQTTLEALNDAAPHLAGRLGRQMHLKYAPKLKFVPDTMFDEAARMEKLITEALRELPSRSDEDDRHGS